MDGYRISVRFPRPTYPSKTVEGYPAPKRAVLIARSRKGLVLLPDAA